MEGEGALVLAEEFAEGCDEVRFDEAGERRELDFGWRGRRRFPVCALEGLNGLDCFGAQDAALDKGTALVPRAAPDLRESTVARECILCGFGGEVLI